MTKPKHDPDPDPAQPLERTHPPLPPRTSSDLEAIIPSDPNAGPGVVLAVTPGTLSIGQRVAIVDGRLVLRACTARCRGYGLSSLV
jgi:hypothetical protein